CNSSLQELVEWNNRYRQKFGLVFLICASERSTPEILEELKKRYPNRPIVEFEIAAQEEMKIIELRLAKLFAAKAEVTSPMDRVRIIGEYLTVASEVHGGKASQTSARTRPPITTHVLEVSRGSPAAGIEVQLEMWDHFTFL
ncbi:PREDICTED: uric acid degradation bifunctional protein TTL-like, partial [Nelumbo nucifera]|uniref:2-oxo-4-hydroxy-4-carboxy-5-ureidoimidazoline decarboxylase n=1 Tax=Nelumbo nucifera TaxID=4432 RepID=A0A1U8B9X6_NELNU